MRMAMVLLCVCALGCEPERWEEAPELRPELVEADDYIAEHFGKRFCDLSAIDLYWADATFATEGNDVFIERGVRGRADEIAVRMQHELFHLTTGLRDREATFYNGVRIADWIAYGMAKRERCE